MLKEVQGVLWILILPLPNRPLPHDLCHGWDSPRWLPALHYAPDFAQVHIHWVGDAIQPSHPLLPLLLSPSISPSVRVFSSESSLPIRWPKYWSFSVNLSSEYSGLISFRSDWFDLLAVQGTLEFSPARNSKASILWRLAFFIVQLSHPYVILLYWECYLTHLRVTDAVFPLLILLLILWYNANSLIRHSDTNCNIKNTSLSIMKHLLQWSKDCLLIWRNFNQ